MNTRSIISSILIIALALNACDCMVDHKGFVIDEHTNTPIPQATILFDNKHFESDEKGFFEISYITGFCPKAKFLISKMGYKNMEFSIQWDSEITSYQVLERSNDSPHGYRNANSTSFAVKNDTLLFYLEHLK